MYLRQALEDETAMLSGRSILQAILTILIIGDPRIVRLIDVELFTTLVFFTNGAVVQLFDLRLFIF
jgi:hypothetical protein